jgi:hypothetical protein
LDGGSNDGGTTDGGTTDGGLRAQWGEMVLPGSARWMYTIFAVSESEIYAAGDLGQILRYDGTGWMVWAPRNPSNYTVHSIWVADGKIYAGTDIGLYVVTDANTWQLYITRGVVAKVHGFP